MFFRALTKRSYKFNLGGVLDKEATLNNIQLVDNKAMVNARTRMGDNRYRWPAIENYTILF